MSVLKKEIKEKNNNFKNLEKKIDGFIKGTP